MLFKIKIVKAFDSVSWPFLLEVLEHLGFSKAWTNWILVLLSSASTKVMVNGIQGNKICHARGLRQWDLISKLFLMVMEFLNLIQRADERALLQPLGLRSITHRALLYADDVRVFLSSIASDIVMFVQSILSCFERASGLSTNLAKCSVTQIHCGPDEVETIQSHLCCLISNFLCMYLGTPLSMTR